MKKSKEKNFQDIDEIKKYLLLQNEKYIKLRRSKANVSLSQRVFTCDLGQHPYVTIITCSDSRVPVEHIFNAGIGELFVIRSAGNVIGDFELGSVEYGVEHLHTKLILVLGHTNCGAVDAALNSKPHGAIAKITDEILNNIPSNLTNSEAEIYNVRNSIRKINESVDIKQLIENKEVEVIGGIYDIRTGKVIFL